jgi:hypothetical protein
LCDMFQWQHSHTCQTFSRASGGSPTREASDDDEDDQDEDYRVFGRMTMKAQSEVGGGLTFDSTHTPTHTRHKTQAVATTFSTALLVRYKKVGRSARWFESTLVRRRCTR